MKKLIWYYPHLYFWMGGAKFVFEVTVRLKKHFDVSVICNGGDKEIIKQFESRGVRVIVTSSLSTNSMIYWLLFPLFVTYDLAGSFKYLKNADHIIGSIYPANLICALYGLILKKEFYFFCYEPFPFFHHKRFISKFSLPKIILLKVLSFLYGWSDIWAAKKAESIFTVDKYKAELIKNVYGKNSIITSVGIDFKSFRHYRANNIAQKFNNRIMVTHSTDYTPFKHTEFAIRAISHLVKKYPNILLIITSTQPDSPYKEKYLQQVKRLKLTKNVSFVGLLPEKLLPLYYSASRCYLSTAMDEILADWPVKEALASETPAIRSAIGLRDVEDNVSGFLVDPTSTKLIAEKIDFLIKNPKKAKEMGKNGRKKMIENYSWEAVIGVIIKNLRTS